MRGKNRVLKEVEVDDFCRDYSFQCRSCRLCLYVFQRLKFARLVRCNVPARGLNVNKQVSLF